MSQAHVAKGPQPKAVTVNDRTERTFNLPNTLTFIRILLVPVYIGLFSTPTAGRSLWAAAVFGSAALTDWLDGYIARRRGQVTKIGRLFDPIADKFLVISGLVLLVQFQRVAAWLAIALIVRDLGRDRNPVCFGKSRHHHCGWDIRVNIKLYFKLLELSF